MHVDSLSESASVYALTKEQVTDCNDVELNRERVTDRTAAQFGSRSGRYISGQESTAKAEVQCGSRSALSDTILARFEQAAIQDRPRLLWLAQRVVRRREVAEEIVQESLLKAFRALPRFRDESRMRTWLYAIVRNATLEHLRNQREPFQVSLEHFSDGDGVSVYDPPDFRNTPEDYYKTAEMQTILLDEIDGLSRCCKDAFQTCVLEENSQSEAAAALNVSVAKIKSRVCRAKRILSTRVRRHVGLFRS
jgi:RNA polymerase sigma-70 factor (ECF subfamily)